MSCIFCKIIANEAEASKIYEDDDLLAFLDIHPVREGQTLIVPKHHVDHFSDIPDQLASRIFLKAHQLSKVIRQKLNPERMGLVVHGYGVPHAHLIIVPQADETDITSGRMAEIRDGKIIYSMEKLPSVPRPELDRLAKIIRDY